MYSGATDSREALQARLIEWTGSNVSPEIRIPAEILHQIWLQAVVTLGFHNA